MWHAQLFSFLFGETFPKLVWVGAGQGRAGQGRAGQGVVIIISIDLTFMSPCFTTGILYGNGRYAVFNCCYIYLINSVLFNYRLCCITCMHCILTIDLS